MNQAVQANTSVNGPRGGSLSAAAIIFQHTVWQLIWGKRLLLVILVAAIPVVLALLFDTVIPANDTAVSKFYLNISMTLIVQLMLPLTAIAFAIGLVSDEVERGTLLYLFTRPIPKAVILLGKVAAYIVVACSFGTLSLVAMYAVLLTKPGAESLATVGGLGAVWPAMILGMLAYGGLFIALGTWFRKPLILAIVFAWGWENLLGYLPGQTRLLTVLYHMRIMVSRGSDDGTAGTPFFVAEGVAVPSAAMSAMILAGIFAFGVGFAIFSFQRQQYTLSRIQ